MSSHWLHLKNNACALAHRYLLQEVLSVSQLPDSVKCFSEIQINPPFVKYVSVMKSKCHLSRLGHKILRWFNETQAKKIFDYRFTGKDSRIFLHNFMFLIDLVNLLQNLELKHILLHMCLLFFVWCWETVSLFQWTVSSTCKRLPNILYSELPFLQPPPHSMDTG